MRTRCCFLYGLLLLPTFALGDNKVQTDPRLAGGETTVFADSENAFAQPVHNASPARQEAFSIGGAFFQQPWVAAPAAASNRDGLGALYRTNTCANCHVQGGRGHPPLTATEDFLSTIVKLSIPAKTPEQQALLDKLGAIPEPTYGLHLQPLGIEPVVGEGTPRFTYQSIQGQFKDGEIYTLQQPLLHIERLHYAPFAPDTQFSVRVAPPLIGVGLLAAVADTEILAHADPDDKDANGISGRVNSVWDVQQQRSVLGRFSWKANQPNLTQQIADALHNDIGITTSLFPEQPCTAVQTACLQATDGGKPEASDAVLTQLVLRVTLLGVPARRDVNDPQVLQGKQLFQQTGCAACHLPSLHTESLADFPELTQQIIHPYTDLLLHDMGEGLADHRTEYQATGNEWRTPPLWGVGLTQTVSGHTRFLHDGRARNLLEAILWHGGEAETAKQAVLALSKTEREALLRFLNSL